MATKRLALLLLMLSGCCLFRAACQLALPSRAFKTLGVANGLPQSFISGLVQDSTGFVWIGTRDGLARYDGKRFKYFRHIPGDTTSLSDNIITNLYLDKKQRLWIYFEAGNVDVLHTATEALFHFTKAPVFKSTYGLLKGGQSFVEDSKGNFWLLHSNSSGLFICNTVKRTLHFYPVAALGLPDHKIASIASSGENIVLFTNTSIVIINEERKILKSVPYIFTNDLGNAAFSWKTVPSIVRANGDIIVPEKDKLLIYNPSNGLFITLPLPFEKNPQNFCITQDSNGRIFFDHSNTVYTLSPQNKLHIWKPKAENPAYGFKSMLVDRSGVLWLGGNGSGIQLYDLRLPRLQGIAYKKNFHNDVLQNFLHVPQNELAATSLYGIESYYIRWAKGFNNDFWIARAGATLTDDAEVYYYAKGHLSTPAWRYTDTVKSNHAQLNSLALSPSGKLWGIDFFLRPVYFDMLTHSVTVYPSLDSVNTSSSFTVSSLLIDDYETFWISTALNGLFSYNPKTRHTIHYSADNAHGSLPTNQLMNIIQDPIDRDILWIGSLGGGLIKFKKSTGRCRIFTMAQGLPNNTVYAVVMDSKGLLWCSSNKGIFSFDPKTGAVLQSFTTKDGLLGDEFNRYHFFPLPDGSISFGGVDGYTVFDPLSIANDDYQPRLALTGISINNLPSDIGAPAPLFKAAINSLDRIVLHHTQNFITFEFAALQYNITEKLQYRYMLEGFDDKWVNAGNNNIAVYTKIAPGNYTLKINATNTAGKWSTHIKTLTVIIQPPFWKTAWFITFSGLAIAAAVYFFYKRRIAGVRKEEQQKARFEKEAAELKAQALRAQMNPHFIFNCLNSIKALIQDDNKRQAVSYLTTFSKLIRAQMNNAEREVSLFEELETCRLYTQLESLRFGDKILCQFKTDGVDTHSIPVPPLIVQPFIENAIWHGILPKGGGSVNVEIKEDAYYIQCTIEDDGIGRELAMRNKAQTTTNTYESKGMKLVQNRLSLYNIMHQHGGSIELVDKRDADNRATGTLVILKFNKGT